MKHEIDTDLITSLLRSHGHSVGNVIPTPESAGEFEFQVDGNLLSLSQVHALLEAEDQREASSSGAAATPASPPPTA